MCVYGLASYQYLEGMYYGVHVLKEQVFKIVSMKCGDLLLKMKNCNYKSRIIV